MCVHSCIVYFRSAFALVILYLCFSFPTFWPVSRVLVLAFYRLCIGMTSTERIYLSNDLNTTKRRKSRLLEPHACVSSCFYSSLVFVSSIAIRLCLLWLPMKLSSWVHTWMSLHILLTAVSLFFFIFPLENCSTIVVIATKIQGCITYYVLGSI